MRHLVILALTFPLFFTSQVFGEIDTERLLQQGYELTEAGRLEEALRVLQEAADKDPESSLVRTRLGGIRILRQEYSAGVKDFQRAIMLDQNNAAAFIGMAVAYLHMGQYSLARAALDEAGKLDHAKMPEIEKVLAWIEQRASSAAASAH